MNRKLIASLCAGASLIAVTAMARTQHASDGSPATGLQAACFNNSSSGATPGIFRITTSTAGNPAHQCTGTTSWDMGVKWDSAGNNRTVLATARLTAAGAVSCTYFGFNSNGTSSVVAPFPAFAATSAYVQQFVTVNVPAGGYGVVRCAMTANTGSRLLGVDYFPQ